MEFDNPVANRNLYSPDCRFSVGQIEGPLMPPHTESSPFIAIKQQLLLGKLIIRLL